MFIKDELTILETKKIDKTDIVDNLYSKDSTKVLSAKQGNELKDLLGHTGGISIITDDEINNLV